MHKLTVVTLSSLDKPNYRKAFLEECKDSVASQLPKNSKHEIIHCTGKEEIPALRWNATKLSEYICFVDNDDFVMNDSLNLCLNALEDNPTAGIAFTNERYIDIEGNTLPSLHKDDKRVTYKDLTKSPQHAHHLVMIRTQFVPQYCRKILRDMDCLITSDWVIRSSCALVTSAVHIPVEGYAWRKHEESLSMDKTWLNDYSKKMALSSIYLKTLNTRGNEFIPLY